MARNVFFLLKDPPDSRRPDIQWLAGKHLPREGWNLHFHHWSQYGGQTPSGEGRLSFRGKWRAQRRSSHAIERAVRSGEYDCIIIKDVIVPIKQSTIARLPVFYWLSFPFPEKHREVASACKGLARIWHQFRYIWDARVLYRNILPNVSGVIAQSVAMKTWLVMKGISPRRTVAVPMGYDQDEIMEVANRSDRSAIPTVCYSGSLHPVRKPKFITDMAREVARRFDGEFRVVVIGRGDETEYVDFMRMAQYEQVNKKMTVKWNLPRTDALKEVRQSWVGISPVPLTPTFWVSSPTKVVEYMALELPVVASAIPDQEQLCRESGGGIVVDNDPVRVAGAVIQLLSNAETCYDMGKKGLSYVSKERSYHIISRRLSQVLNEWCEAP